MSLRKDFLAFHKANPWVYRRLVKICTDIRGRRWKKYSMRTLIAVLRYEWDLRTGGDEIIIAGGEERRVKLNDHHTAYYARLLAYKKPEFRDFFEFRRVAGERKGEIRLFSDDPRRSDIILGSSEATKRVRRIPLRAAIRR